MTEVRLRIATQKSGRLADRSLEIIQAAGLRVIKGANELLYRIENEPIDLLRVRDDDIPTFVHDGVAELGIVGLNVLYEHADGFEALESRIVMRLGFGKCDLKIAVPLGFERDFVVAATQARVSSPCRAYGGICWCCGYCARTGASAPHISWPLHWAKR